MPSNGSWQKVRFDQICKNISNRIDDPKQAKTDYYVGLEHLDSEDPKILRHGSPQDVSKTKLLFKSGHILFGKRNWYLRRLAVAQREGICSAHMLVLEPIEGKIIKEFLPLLMFSDDFYEKALMVSAGSMSPTIKWKDIAKLEFLIPPIPEQETTLSLTHQIDDAISKTQSLLQQTKIYSVSKRESLLTRGIGHTKFKKVKWLFGKTIEIPEEWKVKQFKDVLELKHGHQFRTEDFIQQEGLKILKIHQLRGGKVDLSNCEYIDKKRDDEFQDFLLKKDDLLISLSGDIGTVSKIQDEIESVYQNYRVGKVIIKKPELITKDYTFHSLRSKYIKNQIHTFIHIATLGNLGKDDVEKLFLFTPQLSEQKQISSILSNINEQISQQQSHLSNLKTMRKSILNSKLTKEKTNVAN